MEPIWQVYIGWCIGAILVKGLFGEDWGKVFEVIFMFGVYTAWMYFGLGIGAS